VSKNPNNNTAAAATTATVYNINILDRKQTRVAEKEKKTVFLIIGVRVSKSIAVSRQEGE
jgi:hypothetical protein